METVPIGSIVEQNGMYYKIIAGDCRSCAFDNDNDICFRTLSLCSAGYRTDNTSIAHKLVGRTKTV